MEDIAIRGAGYNMPGVIVDGADVLACYAAGREAIERARAGEGPTLIEAKVTRLTAHSSDDQQTKYRSGRGAGAEKARDPLPRFREQLRAAGMLDDEASRRDRGRVAQGRREDATESGRGRQPDADAASHRREWTTLYCAMDRPRRSTRGCERGAG